VRLVEVPGVGHAPSLVEPAALEALTDFFAVKA
jgi:pimeloyl-ACP methyl ester carboxylesterase